MWTKRLKIAGNIFLGLNFGMLSPFMPFYLVILMTMNEIESLNANRLAVCGLITAIATAVGIYIYFYKKKREHESLPLGAMTLAVSFLVGAILITALLFIFAAGEEYRI